MMNVTPLADAAKACFDTLSGLNSRALQSVKQLAALNVQTVKTVRTESAENLQAVLSAKSLDELLKLHTSSLRAVPQKAAAYGRHVSEIFVTLVAAQRAAVEAQVSSVQAKFLEGLTGAVKNVPGADKTLVLAKSAIAVVNDVYEGVDKASKQVSDAAAASLTKMTEAVQNSTGGSHEVVAA
jgi:phasin family protein